MFKVLFIFMMTVTTNIVFSLEVSEEHQKTAACYHSPESVNKAANREVNAQHVVNNLEELIDNHKKSNSRNDGDNDSTQ